MKRKSFFGCGETPVSSVHAEGTSLPPPKVMKTDSVVNSLSALYHLESLFPPSEAFACHPPLPVIVLKHQIYSLLEDRTTVDRELASLRDSGSIRMFKLGISEQDYALVREENYCEYLKQYLKEDSLLCRKLTETILPACREVSATYQQLNAKLTLTDNQLSALVRHGVLLPRDVGKMKSWWFAIPGISPFVKSLIKGRSTVQQMLKRSKFKEMLQSELEARKLGVSKLSMPYHIHDLIGSDLLERVSTTSGPLLRLLNK